MRCIISHCWGCHEYFFEGPEGDARKHISIQQPRKGRQWVLYVCSVAWQECGNVLSNFGPHLTCLEAMPIASCHLEKFEIYISLMQSDYVFDCFWICHDTMIPYFQMAFARTCYKPHRFRSALWFRKSDFKSMWTKTYYSWHAFFSKEQTFFGTLLTQKQSWFQTAAIKVAGARPDGWWPLVSSYRDFCSIITHNMPVLQKAVLHTYLLGTLSKIALANFMVGVHTSLTLGPKNL